MNNQEKAIAKEKKLETEQLLEMVTTQVVPDSESTCGTAVCVVSLNTNLSNLTNRAEQNLQVGGNSIRVSLNTNLSNLTNRAGQNLQVGVLKKHESNCFLVEG